MKTEPRELSFRQAYRLITTMFEYYDTNTYGNARLPADVTYLLSEPGLTAKEKAITVMPLIGEHSNACTLVLANGVSWIRVSMAYADTHELDYPCNMQHPLCVLCRVRHSWAVFYMQCSDSSKAVTDVLRQARLA